jgi:hypothetical protein
MSNNDELFENFPHKSLPIPIARSKLFSAIVNEMTANSEKMEGKRVMQLSDLGICSDEELKPLIPLILPKSKISLKDGHVIGKSAMTGESFRLFPISSLALTVFNMMNGINTMEAISQSLAKELNWGMDRSFTYTRGVFLSLVVAGLCMPKE